MSDQQMEICVQYVKIVNLMLTEKGGHYAYEDERIELHDKLCDIFDVDRLTISGLTSRLDVWLGVDFDQILPPPKIIETAQKLKTVLNSDTIQKGSWGSVEDEFKRLRTLWYDDPNFSGWEETHNE